MGWDVGEDVAGKILVREYTSIRPYCVKEKAEKVTYSGLSTFYKNKVPSEPEPWIFQKDIPLLRGEYKIATMVRGKMKIEKKGNGEMAIQRKEDQVWDLFYTRFYGGNGDSLDTSMGNGYYDAIIFTITVSDIMPLPPNSELQPLSVETVRWDKGIHFLNL